MTRKVSAKRTVRDINPGGLYEPVTTTKDKILYVIKQLLSVDPGGRADINTCDPDCSWGLSLEEVE